MADHQKEIEEFGNNDDFWLFGYGYQVHLTNTQQPGLTKYRSLIWKPPPHFGTCTSYSNDIICAEIAIDQRIPGYIEGYVRRFWQVSNTFPCPLHHTIP
jgi:cation transport protein ChaC